MIAFPAVFHVFSVHLDESVPMCPSSLSFHVHGITGVLSLVLITNQLDQGSQIDATLSKWVGGVSSQECFPHWSDAEDQPERSKDSQQHNYVVTGVLEILEMAAARNITKFNHCVLHQNTLLPAVAAYTAAAHARWNLFYMFGATAVCMIWLCCCLLCCWTLLECTLLRCMLLAETAVRRLLRFADARSTFLSKQ